MLAGKFFDLRLANAGAAAIMAALHKDHFFRAATTKIFGPGATNLVLVKTSLNVRGDTGIEGLIGCPDKIDKPLIHALAAISATKNPLQD